MPVNPFIPNPLRCFKCRRFGHSNANYREIVPCARCAVAGHESTNCEATEQCVNCEEKHTSFSRSCPKWKFDKEIITAKVKQDISFREARRQVEAQTPTVGRSYASAAKTFKALSLKVSKTGASLKDLKPKKSIPLESGKAGLATKDVPSLFGNPSTSELLKIHPSEDDDDLQMNCEQHATPLTGVDNSPPPLLLNGPVRFLELSRHKVQVSRHQDTS
ncbi:hypothetical protein AVEN_238343-1 [Araneus ventricosus]|uniref:CCHC-type domain-containing protein n=1 Tax=Araneus ventricosus TaxID=182803 RepID=A0A4Y2KCU5_ARAVE|nr:hypothetical protein AVEN_238343-1 [Araneus ventricosus]